MTVTFKELWQATTIQDDRVIRRLLSGPAGGYLKLELDTEIQPIDAVLVALADWFFNVPRLSESQVSVVLHRVQPHIRDHIRIAWEVLDNPQDKKAVASLYLGMFDSRYISWTTAGATVMDVTTGEVLDQLPHNHMWNLVLDISVLVGRLWGEIKRRREKQDAKPPIHEASAAGS